MKKLIAVVVAGLGMAASASASAAIVAPMDWARPGSDAAATAGGTTYQRWEVFNAVGGPNGPDVAEVNPNGVANTWDGGNPADGSFLTSGGNIYSFSAATSIHTTVPGYGLGAGYATTVLLQTTVQGTELSYADVKLVYNDGTADVTLSPVTTVETERSAASMGSKVGTAFVFNLPYSPASFELLYPASGSSMSMDQVAVDAITLTAAQGFLNAVPEPSVGLLLVAGGLLARRRK